MFSCLAEARASQWVRPLVVVVVNQQMLDESTKYFDSCCVSVKGPGCTSTSPHNTACFSSLAFYHLLACKL